MRWVLCTIFKGWGLIMGIPALFLFAYIYPALPLLPDISFCAVRHFLGFDCPGCGLTRSFVALAHMDFRAGIDAHPLGVVVALWLLYMWGRAVLELASGTRPRGLTTQKGRDILMYSFLAGLLFQWVIRLVF